MNSVEEVKKRSISPEQEAFKKVLKTSSPSPVKETSPVKDTSPPLMEDDKDESRSKSSSPEITGKIYPIISKNLKFPAKKRCLKIIELYRN